MKLPQRERYLYQSCYCEENIWHLCQRPEFLNSDVIIMASRGGFFPILHQRGAETPQTPLLWDYHVVLLWRDERGDHYVLDFDTSMSFCTPAEWYFRQALLDERLLVPEFIPLFRVMPAGEYAASLLSDRRHMKTKDGWLAEPPKWPPISKTRSNLKKFTDMSDHEYGDVLTSTQLMRRLSNVPALPVFAEKVWKDGFTTNPLSP